jgi:hypothetical protein
MGMGIILVSESPARAEMEKKISYVIFGILRFFKNLTLFPFPARLGAYPQNNPLRPLYISPFWGKGVEFHKSRRFLPVPTNHYISLCILPIFHHASPLPGGGPLIATKPTGLDAESPGVSGERFISPGGQLLAEKSGNEKFFCLEKILPKK